MSGGGGGDRVGCDSGGDRVSCDSGGSIDVLIRLWGRCGRGLF